LGLATNGIATLDDSTPLLEPVIYKDSLAQQVISIMVSRVDEYLQNNQFGEVEVGFLLGRIGSTLANLACTITPQSLKKKMYVPMGTLYVPMGTLYVPMGVPMGTLVQKQLVSCLTPHEIRDTRKLRVIFFWRGMKPPTRPCRRLT